MTSVKRHPSSTDPASGGRSRWVVNMEDPSSAREEDIFDAVIVCAGTCGEPTKPSLPGMDQFRNPVLHSSELDGRKAREEIDWRGKKVLVVGGGASAVEAAEAALDHGAAWVGVSARDDKV